MDFQAKLVTWTEIETWCNKLRDQIKNAYKPDAIIGLSRGGLVPSRLISDALLIKDLFAIKTEHWGITATVDGKTVLKDAGNFDLTGKKVIVIDDITDTGESMELATSTVMKMHPSEVKTAAMLHIAHSKFVPDFYAEEVSAEKWIWFIFPWNVYEDISNLTGKILEAPMTSQQISEQLKERFDISIASDSLEAKLDHLSSIGRFTRNGNKWEKA